MKITLAVFALSTFLTANVSAQVPVNEIGYPWNVPADTYNSGDLQYEELFGYDHARNAAVGKNDNEQALGAGDQFFSNPLIHEYLVRETRTWDHLPEPVTQAYVTVSSVLNEQTGENFAAYFSPDATKTLKLLSLQRNMLPMEAQISYLLDPKMEEGRYLDGSQMMRAIQYVKDKFAIPQQSVQEYINTMHDFSTS